VDASNNEAMWTVVLIGPPGAGKSTVGPILAASVGASFVDVDGVGEAYYNTSEQPLASFVERIGRDGFARAHQWWQPARLAAAVGVVRDHSGSVIAFGAGHSHFEDESFAASIRSALAGCKVVLLLPDADPARSLSVLRDRCLATKGHGWSRDGHDFLEDWTASEQNHELADFVVYSNNLTPKQYAEKIAACLRREPRSG
jgi:shikimate kinase